MADHKRAANIADAEGQFDRPALFVLGAWGVVAVLALTTTVFAARSDIGARRLHAAFAAIAASPNDPPQAVVQQLLARTADMEREARRLADAVRLLTTERERLTMRLGMVEREMGDLTGSISRNLAQPANMPDSKPAATRPLETAILPPPAVAPSPTGDAKAPSVQQATSTPPLAPLNEPAPRAQATTEPLFVSTGSLVETVPLPLPRPSEKPSAPQSATGPSHVAAAPAGNAGETAPAFPQTPSPTAGAAPQPSAAAKQSEEPQPKAEIGLDLGPALTMARLRARWTAFKSAHGSIAEGLRPVISIREMGQNKPVEMRLVVGPVPDVHAASQMCAAIVGTQFVCHPAVFDGQRLALR